MRVGDIHAEVEACREREAVEAMHESTAYELLLRAHLHDALGLQSRPNGTRLALQGAR
jgi:hypothetical protein